MQFQTTMRTGPLPEGACPTCFGNGHVQQIGLEATMDAELLALRLHNAQLAAALRAIVDRDLGYLDGFVSAGLIPMQSIWQARGVLRATGNAGVTGTLKEKDHG